MSDPIQPTSAVVPVSSSWLSKINWVQAVSILATIISIWGIDMDAKTQVAVVGIIQGIQTVVTWVLRTWFTTSVTSAAMSGAPLIRNQSQSVQAVTPAGPVATTVTL